MSFVKVSTYDVEMDTTSGNGVVKLWLKGGGDNPSSPNHTLKLSGTILTVAATILSSGNAYFDSSAHRLATGWNSP